MTAWTPARRLKQSKAIKQWQPWVLSTGAKSESGKKKVSQNAYKGGLRPFLRELASVLREQRNMIDVELSR